MTFIHKKITITYIENVPVNNTNDELKWFGLSIGLFNLRDKDKSCFRIFIELVKAAKKNSGLSSDQLAERIGVSRGTVVHHLNKLMASGIVVYNGNVYTLSSPTLTELTRRLEHDLLRTLKNLQKVTKHLDETLEME